MAALTHGPRLGSPSSSGFSVWAKFDGAAVVVLQVRVNGTTAWTTADTGAVNTSLLNTVTLEVTDLLPKTKYDYRLLADGVEVASYYTRTLPVSGRLVVYQHSDQHGNTDNAYILSLGDYQANYEPLGIPGVLLQTGDLVTPMTVETPEVHAEAVLLEIAEMGDTVKYLPLCYMWDDWDFGGDNSAKEYLPAFSSHADALKVWEYLWRDMPRHAAPSFGYAIDLAGVPLIMADQRSQRTAQTSFIPSTQGDEPLSDSVTAYGLEQRAWILSQLIAAREKGLVLFLSTTTMRDNVNVFFDPGEGAGGRDSVGIFYKAERNYIFKTGLQPWTGNLVALTGDDHYNAVWRQDMAEPTNARAATGVARPGVGTGCPYIQFKVASAGLVPIIAVPFTFGRGNYFQRISPLLTGDVLRIDLTTANGGQDARARFTHLLIPSGNIDADDATGVPADFFYHNGYFNYYDPTATEQNQLYPPDNGQTSGTFQRWYTDDVSGAMISRVNVERDHYERLRYFKDIETQDRDELLQIYNPRHEKEFDDL